jgi:hypothetical protein
MKALRIALALVATVMTALAFAAPASAATVTVSADDFYIVEVGEFGIPGTIIQGSDLSFTWSSDVQLTLIISGPSGLVKSYSSSTHGSHTIEITETGDYFMTWTNSGSSDAALTYDYDVDIFAPVHNTIDSILLGVMVGVIVVVVVIVLVVVLVLRGDRDKKPAQAQYVQPAAPVAPAATNCPNCGAAIDATVQWCARCGAKLR